MLRTSGEILIGNPTGYNSGSSVQRPITRKMIRRSIFNMRSENVMSGPFPLPAIHALREAPSGGRGYTHPPSDCLAIDFPGRGLHFFSPAPTLRTPRRAICPSARSLSQPLSLQGAGFVDLLLRAWTSTAYLRIRWIWCARSASKGDQQPSHPSFFPSAQIRAFDAENNFERERDGAETDADQNSPADRGVEHIENPLGDIAAQWKQILPEWYPAHHDDHRCHQQHGGLA